MTDGYVYDFSVDYDAISVDDIHNYLMKKNDSIIKRFGLLKSVFFTGLAFLSTLTGEKSLTAVPLSCISMNKHK